jgi:uncharacterized membrane protein YdfJ with MMPL/SSD domain
MRTPAAHGLFRRVGRERPGSSLLGLPGTGPISPFIPVLMFSVLFGLSMDYEVFLVSRIQEEWRRLHRGNPTGTSAVESRRNHEAVVLGQASGLLRTRAARRPGR